MTSNALDDLAKAITRLQETIRENGIGVPTPPPAPVRPPLLLSQLSDEERAEALSKIKTDLMDGLDASRLSYLDRPGAMPIDAFRSLYVRGPAS